MHVTTINEAEAIIAPFWDPELNELQHWTIDSGTDHGLVVLQDWCWVTFEWTRRSAQAVTLRMRRTCGIDCGDYDRLLLCVMAPERSVVRILAETDRGPRRLEAPPAGPKKKELALDLEGAQRLEAVIIEIEAGDEGIAEGWFNWLGLQHTGRLAHKLKTQAGHDSAWEGYLKSEDFQPRFTPAYGLVLNDAELVALRGRHDALLAEGKSSPFLAAGEAALAAPPEVLIHDFVNFWNDSRYNRERDHGKYILSHGLNAAIAGHLLQDKALLRLAARFALSIGMCTNWDDGFICRFPGSTFEHRCFVQSLCAYEVAGILDLAGECFTDLGRDLLLRRLAEEAIGTIHFNTWKFDYIFECNQLAWFAPGRMLALAVLNRHWPRTRQYMDIAYRELCESLESSILPDGGYVEGPTYFRCVGRDAGLGIYYYSRAIGEPMQDLIPPAMKRCGDFGETLMSTDDAGDMVPICDGNRQHDPLSLAILAGLLPQSAWSRMLQKTFARNDGWPTMTPLASDRVPMVSDAAIAWSLTEQLPQISTEPAVLIALPAMGPMASHRRLGDHWVKLFIQGNHAGAGHTHEDKGSFVLEFAGDTFAMDPGTCDYSHPLAAVLKNCERHNMLIPYGMTQRPHPLCPLPHDVTPQGTGDSTTVRARIDLTPGWEEYYRRWTRVWDSPSPDRLSITDAYELIDGAGVDFYWQTRLPVTIDAERAIITGRRGRAQIEAPSGIVWELEQLPLLDGVQHRLSLRQPGDAGTLTVQVRLLS
ncbi:MAG: hypothetical protein HN712_30680 [Gemmatimonadetes bacterium]|nr:hypothetical protein [Gemmatimonadota bacterium]